MKNLSQKLNNLVKAIAKKLNNYRLTAFILAIVSVVAGVVSLGLMFIYYFAGNISSITETQQPSFAELGKSGKILGMFFFLFMCFVIICSIAITYNLVPALKNKEKVTPKKSPLIMAIVNGGLEIVVLIFSILAITLETPNTLALYIVAIPFIVITAIMNIMAVIPLTRCVFYQPAIGSKLFAKKAKVSEEVKAE